MKKLVAVKIETLDLDTWMSGYVGRSKNRKVVWRIRLNDRNRSDVIKEAAANEEARLAGDAPLGGLT